jgi:hypothetical protein
MHGMFARFLCFETKINVNETLVVSVFAVFLLPLHREINNYSNETNIYLSTAGACLCRADR